MAATTLLRTTPLFGGEGEGRTVAGWGPVGVVGSGQAWTRALTPNLCLGRAGRLSDLTTAGSVAAAEGSGIVSLVPRPGGGG